MVEPADMSFESKVKVKVPIVDDYRKEQPFAMNSRHGIAIVFAFYGDSDQVGEFMQKASNKTRAYYINANGLQGFVVPYSIIALLK